VVERLAIQEIQPQEGAHALIQGLLENGWFGLSRRLSRDRRFSHWVIVLEALTARKCQ
jgi:hypothetical protein